MLVVANIAIVSMVNHDENYVVFAFYETNSLLPENMSIGVQWIHNWMDQVGFGSVLDHDVSESGWMEI